MLLAYEVRDPLIEWLDIADNITGQNNEQAEDAIEHMVFLTDAGQLYFNALGLYDLELTLMVAQQAQRVSTILGVVIYSNTT